MGTVRVEKYRYPGRVLYGTVSIPRIKLGADETAGREVKRSARAGTCEALTSGTAWRPRERNVAVSSMSAEDTAPVDIVALCKDAFDIQRKIALGEVSADKMAEVAMSFGGAFRACDR